MLSSEVQCITQRKYITHQQNGYINLFQKQASVRFAFHCKQKEHRPTEYSDQPTYKNLQAVSIIVMDNEYPSDLAPFMHFTEKKE